MSFELIYTSAPRGLKIGTKGFSTVAMTANMPAHCVQLCESMSGYTHIFGLNDPRYDANPVSWSHYNVKCGGRDYSICSRISSHPKDYTGRTNKIAHHLMLENPTESSRMLAGPAAVMSHGLPWVATWDKAPGLLPPKIKLFMPAEDDRFTAYFWIKQGLSPDYAGIIANAVWQDPVYPVFLLFDPAGSLNLLSLIEDSLRLLPHHRRWQVSFSTYFTSAPAGVDCAIRCCVKDSEAAAKAAWMPNAVVIDLTQNSLTSAIEVPNRKQRFVLAATKGVTPVWAEPPPQISQDERDRAGEVVKDTVMDESVPAGGLKGPASRRGSVQPKKGLKSGSIIPKEKKSPAAKIITFFLVVMIGAAFAAYRYFPSDRDGNNSGGDGVDVQVSAAAPIAEQKLPQVPVVDMETSPRNAANISDADKSILAGEAGVEPTRHLKGTEEAPISQPDNDVVRKPPLIELVNRDKMKPIPLEGDITAGVYFDINGRESAIDTKIHNIRDLMTTDEIEICAIERGKISNFYITNGLLSLTVNNQEYLFFVYTTDKDVIRVSFSGNSEMVMSNELVHLMSRLGDQITLNVNNKDFDVLTIANTGVINFSFAYNKWKESVDKEKSNRLEELLRSSGHKNIAEKKKQYISLHEKLSSYSKQEDEKRNDSSNSGKKTTDELTSLIAENVTFYERALSNLVARVQAQHEVVTELLSTNTQEKVNAHKALAEITDSQSVADVTSKRGKIIDRNSGDLFRTVLSQLVSAMNSYHLPEWYDVLEVVINDVLSRQVNKEFQDKSETLMVVCIHTNRPAPIVQFEVPFTYTK